MTEAVTPVGLGSPSPPSARVHSSSSNEFQRVLEVSGSEEQCRLSIQNEVFRPNRAKLPPAPGPIQAPHSPTKNQQLCPGIILNFNPLSSPARASLKKKKTTWKTSPPH